MKIVSAIRVAALDNSLTRTCWTLLPLVAIVIAGLAPTSAAEDGRWNLRGWTPSVSLGIGMMSTGPVDGSVRSIDSSDSEIRPASTNEDFAIGPLAEISLGLESPRIKFIPLQPRVFVSADYLPIFSIERNVAGEGTDNPLTPPPFPGFPAEAVQGQGSKTKIETGSLAYGVTAGLSFPFALGGYRFHIKPGVSWMRFKLDVEGSLKHAVKPQALGSNFRAIDIVSNGKLYLHGVGPFLELESEGGALGPVFVSFYVHGAMYNVIGDRKMNLGVISEFDDDFGQETYLTRWTVEADDWFYRIGLGARFYLRAKE